MANKSNELTCDFIDLEINNCIPNFRKIYSNEYSVIYEVVRYLKSVENEFIGKDASQKGIFLFSAVIELNRLFQSAVLLFERGLRTSAQIIIRTILELSFNIVEMIKNEEYIQAILFNEIKEADKTVKTANEFNKIDLISPEMICKIQETYRLLSKDNPNAKNNVKELAKKNGFEVEYLTYKTYCTATHVSASVLGKNFKASSSGITFDAGCQLSDFKNDIRSLIGSVLISIPCLVNNYFRDEELSQEYNIISNNFMNTFA
jgi:hypothetical protein